MSGGLKGALGLYYTSCNWLKVASDRQLIFNLQKSTFHPERFDTVLQFRVSR